MRGALAALLLTSVACLPGCKDRSRAPAAKAAEATTPRDAAAAPSPAAAKTGAFAPAVGSWAHAVPISRCVVRLRPAPAPEIERLRSAAVDKLATLGADLEVEMTELGDRVRRADILIPRTPPRRAVLNAKTIREIGQAALIEYGELFGLTMEETRHAKLKTERVRDFPGVAWEVTSEIRRDGTGPMPVRVGEGLVVVELDARGAVVGIDVHPNLLPPVTVCEDSLDRDSIQKAVIGRPLEYAGDTGPASGGTVGPGDVQDSRYRVRVVRGAGEDGDVTVGGVIEVKVEHDFMPWILLIDPSAGIVIETAPDYDEDSAP